MPISKETADEVLRQYLDSVLDDPATTNKILKHLHTEITAEKKKEIKEEEEREKREAAREKRFEKRQAKAKVSHGTSCPRIMAGDELLFEM